MSNPLSSTLSLKENKKVYTWIKRVSFVRGVHHVGKSVPFSHPFQYFGSGTLGLWQNRVHRKTFVGQLGVVGRLVHAHSLLLWSMARSISGHERSRVQFHEGIPNHQDLVQWFPSGGGSLVLDDLMDERSNDKRVLVLFTKHSHHQNVIVLYLCQDMFPVGKYAKSICRNAHYTVVFKKPRDQLGCATFSFNRFPPRGKTVWTPFIVPRHDLTVIWCWTCLLRRTTVVESPLKRRRMDALLSKATRVDTR